MTIPAPGVHPKEMQAIIEAPDPRTWTGQRDRALFSLMYNTGARVSESTVCASADQNKLFLVVC
jgi:site-specific recombinase XerD